MTDSYPPQSPETVDARLNAYRRLLIGVMTHLAGDEAGRRLLEGMVRDTQILADHEEDPGVLPDQGFAAQSLADEEIRTVVATALTRAQALSAQDPHGQPGTHDSGAAPSTTERTRR